MSSLALSVNLNSAGKIVYDLLAFFPWDRFYCCLNFSFQVRNTLEVVDIDPVFKIFFDFQEFLPWDRFYCCLNFSFQVRSTLGVVDIDPVFKIFQKITIRRV